MDGFGVETNQPGFDYFFDTVGVRVRRALVAAYGVEVGTEAAADAMLVAWGRWPDLGEMANPAGYLFRVGQSKAREHLRWVQRRRPFLASVISEHSGGDRSEVIDVFQALAQLRPAQRSAVMLVRSYGFTYAETAEVLNVSEQAVANHVHRGMKKLRTIMEVTP